jgi:2-oxoglutarate ferredoxin oxidoreductase subunit beta
VDVFQPHLKTVLRRAAAHGGTAFIEILQNCNIFNDGAWEGLTEKDVRDDHTILLEHGKPLVFGKNRDKGIRMRGIELEVVALGDGVTETDLIVHDEAHPNPAYAFLLSRMDGTPGFPTPLGVLRAVDAPRYETGMNDQLRQVVAKKGKGDLGQLLRAGDTWEVR